MRFRSLIILAQGTVSSSLGVFLSLEASASAFRAAHPFGFACQRIKFRRVLRFRPGSFADLLASAFSHLDNRTLSDENLSLRDLRLSFLKLSPRPISISKLVCYHTYTADLSPGSPPGVLLPYRNGNLILEVSFTLRCFQRFFFPYTNSFRVF